MKKKVNKKCHWFWGHNYGKWYAIERGDILSNLSKGVKGKYLIQERVCLDCNFKELKKQEI